MIGFNWLLPLLFLLALPLLPFVAEVTALLAFAIAAALICWPDPVMVRIVGAGYMRQADSGCCSAIDDLSRLATLPDLTTAQNLNCRRHGSTSLFHFRNGAAVSCDRIDANRPV
jgi:hypothetical protein